MSRKTIDVSIMIYWSLEELAKLTLQFDKSPKRPRNVQNTMKKTQEASR